ncbi:MAG: marine proteobacterial sortase target protein [Gammaproteobacteria bacterium]|nr:MAG: marine proteobacterial sortase target protein [Gammaproteobacteria bacterium]
MESVMLRLLKQVYKKRNQREYLTEKYSSGTNYLSWFIRFLLMLLAIFAMLFVLILSDAVYAATDESGLSQVSMQDIASGSLLLKTEIPGIYQQLPLLHTDVDMQISGLIVRSHLKQQFKNPTGDWVEAVYVFPLPEQAAVDHMRMYLNDRIIEGMIEEKQEARRIYEQAKSEGKKTALVEQQRPNMFTNSVASIGPGETVMVEIEYQQVLAYDNGQFSLRFPLAITPRYIPGKPISETISVQGSWALNTDQVPDASQITPPVHVGTETINPVSLSIELNPGYPLEHIGSAYHAITQQMTATNEYRISLAEAVVASDRDFELHWQPAAGHEPRAAVFNEEVKGKYYQLLMLMPPHQKSGAPNTLPREVIYIIDTSGSMSGVSMEQARQSLLMALDRLRPTDRFNVIQFNSLTEQLFARALSADANNIQRAKHYVQRLQADGGTEMAPALRAALNKQHESQLVRQVIFMTDGSVGNETELFDIIKQNLGQSRLFTIGIGSAPNSYFMHKAAQHGRGSFTYIGDVAEVQQKMSDLFSKLESPVMMNIKTNFPPGIQVETWPDKIPDLYQGEPLVIVSQSDRPIDQISISGVRDSAPWQATLDLVQDKPANGVGIYWARSKIAALMDSLHEGADKILVRDEVVRLALDHHLVSPYTSLVAVDVSPARLQQNGLQTHTLPVNLPRGQSYEKIFGLLPQTATSAELNLWAGVLLVLFGIGLYYSSSTRNV